MDSIEELKNQIKDLSNALRRLDEALKAEETDLNRDAAIQRFEFCFELSWKLMKNINTTLGSLCASPRDCIRLAAQNGLLENPEKWFEYLTARNIASHVYDELQAKEVYTNAKEFLSDGLKLLHFAQHRISSL